MRNILQNQNASPPSKLKEVMKNKFEISCAQHHLPAVLNPRLPQLWDGKTNENAKENTLDCTSFFFIRIGILDRTVIPTWTSSDQ